MPASGCSLTYTARELVDAGYTVDNGGGHAVEQREREVLALKQEVANVKSQLDKESADTLIVGNRLKACVCVCVCVCVRVYAWSLEPKLRVISELENKLLTCFTSC